MLPELLLTGVLKAPETKPKMSSQMKTHIALQVADFATSQYGLSLRGDKELNPIMPKGLLGMALVKTASAALMNKYSKSHPEQMKKYMKAINLLYLSIVISNIHQITKVK